jgi:hypothetical protein
MEPVATVAGQGFGEGLAPGQVQRIAQQGGAHRCAMDANLMGAAAADRHFHQVSVAAPFEQGELAAGGKGGGIVAAAGGPDGPQAWMGLAGDWSGDREFCAALEA